MGQIQTQNQILCHYLKFGSLFFPKIAYIYSLQQCLTSSRRKSMKKNLGPKFGPKQAKIGPKIRFSAIFSSLVHQFKLNTVIACNNFQHLVKVKFIKKFFGAQIWVRGAKIKPETRFFAIFSSLILYFSWNLHAMIACKNVQRVVEVMPMKKDLGPKFGPKMPKSIPELVFCYFFKFDLLVFLEISYNITSNNV